MEIKPVIDAHYLKLLAPFTGGNTALTEALNGAAVRIENLEQENAKLEVDLQALQSEVDEYQKLARRLVTDTTSRWALDRLVIKALGSK